MRTRLLLLALLEGGLVMLLETASPLVVAPILGHSVIIWAVMLSLSVGALSIGYLLGSWFTKKKRSYDFLMQLFYIITMSLLTGWFLLYLQNYSSLSLSTPVFSWLIVVFILVIPLILFGSSTPVIVALICEIHEESGAITGNVFSVSTIGGILFSILTGFYLIDTFGVSKTLIIAVFLCTTFPLFFFLRKNKQYYFQKVTILGGGVLMIFFLFKSTSLPNSDQLKVQHFSEGITGQLLVADFIEQDYLQRIFFINRMGQSRIFLEDNSSVWTYVNYITAAASIYPKNSKSLVLGLGGGTLPHQIKRYLDHDVVAVELDERIISISNEFFNPFNVRVRKVADDARRFTKRTRSKFDFIALDIFNGEIMPSHGLSKEAFQDLDKILKPGGLIVINFNGFLTGKEGVSSRSLIKTIEAAGFKTELFDASMGKQKEEERNLLFFAFKQTPKWTESTIRTDFEGKRIYFYNHFMNKGSIDLNNSFLITDDKPLMEYINRHAAKKWREGYTKNYTKVFKNSYGLPLVK